MRCPFCQHPDNRVLESRSAEAGQSVRRRRECLNCGRRFTTYERIEYIPITVIKRNGDRESFDRSKLLKSVILACEKTRTSSLKLEALVDDIEAELQQRSIREVSSSEIGELVLQQLQTINPVAYVRFASIHRQFTQIHDFTEALEHLRTVSLEQRSSESDGDTLQKTGSEHPEGREEQDTDLEALIRDQLVYNSNH